MGTLHELFPHKPRPEEPEQKVVPLRPSDPPPASIRINRVAEQALLPPELKELAWQAAQEYISLPLLEKEMLAWKGIVDWIYERSGVKHREHRKGRLREHIAYLLMAREHGDTKAKRLLAEPRLRTVLELGPLEGDEPCRT